MWLDLSWNEFFVLLFLYRKVWYESYPPPLFYKQILGIGFSHSKLIPHTLFFATEHSHSGMGLESGMKSMWYTFGT